VAPKETKAKKESPAKLKMLIVDNDPAGGQMLNKMLAPYGDTEISLTVKEAINAFRSAMKAGNPYDLVCIDIVPERDTGEIVKQIRETEKEKGVHALDGVKIMITTAATDSQNNRDNFKSGCEGYLKKPVAETKLINLLKTLSFEDNNPLLLMQDKEMGQRIPGPNPFFNTGAEQ
jgi:two-component system chemotaxis response regulator CheY